MFGKNPIRKQDLTSPDYLRVQEIFGTIQGEGPYQGTPAVFLRLWGCNLKCFWCDTDFESGTLKPSIIDITLSINDAFSEMGTHPNYPRRLVVITGGEPFRQNLVPLIQLFADRGWLTQIETNGTLWIDGIERHIKNGDLTLVCSPKTGRVHDKFYSWCKNWKYIIDAETVSESDGLPLASTQSENRRMKIARPNRGPADTVWVQPMDMDHMDPALTLANTKCACDIAMRHGYRLCIQQHKVVGLP